MILYICIDLNLVSVSYASITPPSSFNGSFDNCDLEEELYLCNNHQIFDSSTDTTQYYEWNTTTLLAIIFLTNPLQQVEVLMTYFIPDTSDEVRLLFAQTNETDLSRDNEFSVSLPANEQRYNFSLPSTNTAFHTVLVTLISGTIAVNRIVFCGEPKG